MKKIRFQAYAVLLALLWSAASLYGQSDRATITGRLSDPSGAVLTGVRVIAIETETGRNFTASSNNVGLYTIPDLPIGSYALELRQSGFQNYEQTGISLIAGQVLEINVHMAVGSNTETVKVVGAPLLETETSSVSTTLEESAIRDLPLNAENGRDALNLMLATVPAMSGSIASTGTQDWIHLAGGLEMSNSVFVDGVESTAGNQGSIPTPGLDAIQEMQVATASTDAETGSASGGAEMFVLKSGTNRFHGSGFYFYQNEGLNANGWENNSFLSQCAPSDTTCQSTYRRPDYRFNDYGGSAGGPIWKNHTFIFGDYEYYSQANWSINPTGETVPTPQMLTGDFSQLLTGGANKGDIQGPGGAPWINPCTGLAYQYGQIFDPLTQKVVGGQTCATPFAGNVIPAGRLSAVAQKVAAIYTKYYTPTITNTIYNNFPSNTGNPSDTKKTFDIKVDHYFSASHHLSGSYDTVEWTSLGWNGGIEYADNASPLSSYFSSTGTNRMIRVIDNYTFTPTLLNTLAIGFSRQPTVQEPQNAADPSTYGFDNPDSKYIPVSTFGTASNGIGYPTAGTGVSAYYTYNAFHYQDTVAWQKGRHGFRFGGTWLAQGMNSAFGGNIQTYNFASDTGGPIDPGLTPFVGNGLASFMLGGVYNGSEAVNQSSYPRQKAFALFAVDDFKMNPKLTLNLGLRWDVNLPGHEQAGRWANFDLTLQNPVWAPEYGAWDFAKTSGASFEKIDLREFGPHLGAAYQVMNKLVARASYGLFYVPLGTFSSGYGPWFPANQTSMSFGVSQVLNTNQGSTAFDWDNGYPAVPVVPPQNITATSFGTENFPMYIEPHFLSLGHTQSFYLGTQYELARNVLLDTRYMGSRSGNLHDYGRSYYKNYPDFSTYQPVLLAGDIYTQITSPADAARVSAASGVTVPYPYAGFSGPAYAAIAAFPQVAAAGTTVESFGDLAANDSSSYNAFIIELKARNTHGLYLDYSYTVSKVTGGQLGLDNFANNWGYSAQSLTDWTDTNHWIQSFDQRNLAKGYVMYALPSWKTRQWMQNSKLVDNVIGGWEIGYYGSYGSGTPIGPVLSTYQLQYYFGSQRGNFANGATAYNMRNHLNRRLLNPADPLAATNNDFATSSFSTTTAAAPFGNTPYLFNHWRWNPGPANESMSFIKHITFGPEGRFNASLRGEFFNVFNRHYFNAPDTNLNDATFGQVTSAYGNRVGQLGVRIEW